MEHNYNGNYLMLERFINSTFKALLLTDHISKFISESISTSCTKEVTKTHINTEYISIKCIIDIVQT